MECVIFDTFKCHTYFLLKCVVISLNLFSGNWEQGQNIFLFYKTLSIFDMSKTSVRDKDLKNWGMDSIFVAGVAQGELISYFQMPPSKVFAAQTWDFLFELI